MNINSFADKYVAPVYNQMSKSTYLTKTFSNQISSAKFTRNLLLGQSLVISGFYVYNVNKNKNIPEERKKTLNLNTMIGFALSTVCTLIFDKPITKGIENLVSKINITPAKFQNYSKQIKESAKKALEIANENKGEIAKKITDTELMQFMTKQLQDNAKMIGKFIYIVLAVRFLGPVLATPLADMASKFLKKRNDANNLTKPTTPALIVYRSNKVIDK